MKSRLHYNKQLKLMKKVLEESHKKFPQIPSNDNVLVAFKLGYQTRIADEYEENGVRI